MRKKEIVRLGLISALVLVTLLASACGQKQAASSGAPSQGSPPAQPKQEQQAQQEPDGSRASDANKPEKITIGVPASSGSFLFLPFGEAKGIYAAEGLKLDVQTIKPDISLAAMIAGDVDYVAAIGVALRAAAKDLPVKVVMTAAANATFAMYAKPEIKTIVDLKGKVVSASSVGAGTETSGLALLQANGLTPGKDVTLIYVGGGADRLNSVIGGAAQATMLDAPLETIPAEAAGLKRIGFYPDIEPNHPMTGISASDKKIKENPEQVRRMIRGTLKTIDYMYAHSGEVVAFIKDYWKLSDEDSKEAYKEMFDNRFWSRDGSFDDQGMRKEIEVAKASVKIQGDVPVSQVANTDLLKQVQQELGLAK